MASKPLGKAARNERTKLVASSLNAIGLAVAAVGVLQPIYNGPFSAELVTRVALSAPAAYTLHRIARVLLRELED